jgi:hypothetical protein
MRLPLSFIRANQSSPSSPVPALSTWDDYASLFLGSGGKISGSKIDLTSEFSFRYL